MIRGRAAAFAIFMIAAPIALAAPTPAEWGLEPLMARLQQIKSRSAHFVERKEVGMLTRRLETSGTLKYVAPGWLEKITTQPAPESILLQGGVLSGTERNGDHYKVSLEDHPEIAALVEGVRSTLAGDLPTLRRYYLIEFTGTEEDWRLTLTPKDKSIRETVDAIRIGGADAVLKTVDVQEDDGDHSEMVITPDSR